MNAIQKYKLERNQIIKCRQFKSLWPPPEGEHTHLTITGWNHHWLEGQNDVDIFRMSEIAARLGPLAGFLKHQIGVPFQS